MQSLFSTAQSRQQLLCVAIAALYSFAAIWAYHGYLISDEYVHFFLIDHFHRLGIHGDEIFDFFYDSLTTLPGYHFLVTGLMSATHAHSLGSARLFNLLFGLTAIGAFRLLRLRCNDDKDLLAIAQFAVLPVLLPFFFLVYTDTLSLVLVLAATFTTLSGRHWLSATTLLAAMAVRQNNIVWAAFLAAFALWPMLREHGLSRWRDALRVATPYLFDLVAFLFFWSWNGSISFSHSQAHNHPDSTLQCGNIFYTLFLLALLLPLQLAQGLQEYFRRLRKQPIWIAVPLVLLTLFFFGFAVDHPFNLIPGNLCLRNNLLKAVKDDSILRTGFGAVATLAGCGLIGIRLRPNAGYWLYPFAVFCLAASWLIETRYALIPIALWLAMRERLGFGIELATFVYWFVAGTYLCFSIFDYGPFL